MTLVYVAVEGRTDAPIAERMVRFVGLEPGTVIEAGGKSKLDPRIPELNQSGANLNWLVLRDLDHDAPCPSELIRNLVSHISPRVSLRVPVRTVESWVLADAEGFAQEFSIDRGLLPDRPDDLDHPKSHLVDMCRRSRQPKIRQAMAPRPNSRRKVGPEYANRLTAFTRRTWNPERAARRSPSLGRALDALTRLVANGVWR